jgi:hypothetical protein
MSSHHRCLDILVTKELTHCCRINSIHLHQRIRRATQVMNTRKVSEKPAVLATSTVHFSESHCPIGTLLHHKHICTIILELCDNIKSGLV